MLLLVARLHCQTQVSEKEYMRVVLVPCDIESSPLWVVCVCGENLGTRLHAMNKKDNLILS